MGFVDLPEWAGGKRRDRSEQRWAAPLTAKPGVGADRRRAKRFQVDLPGTVTVDGRAYPATISDVSSGGARIMLRTPIAMVRSADIILSIQGFGAIPARIVRAENRFWGVSFLNPQQHRFRLIGWLQQDVDD